MEKPLTMNSHVSKSGTPGDTKNSIRFVFTVCILLISSGCTVFSGSSKGRYFDPFTGYADYAEDVFIRQNQATSEIMMLSEDDMEPFAYEHLQEAENKMQKACELLNEYAVREIDGQSIGLFFKKKVKNSVEGCEYALRNVESILAKLNSVGSVGND